MTPESIYLLSFAPPGLADGRFHELKVQLPVGKHYSVQARPGYVAQSVKSSATGSLASKVDSEVTATNAVADLPISFTWEEVEGQPGVTMIAHLNISRLHFKPWQNRHTQKLSIVAVVLDDHRSFVAGKRSELELSFRDATFAQLAKTGFPVAMTLKVPPGSYSVRAVAQDGIEGRLTAASDAVRIK
jgi:hypothetical protein